MACKEYRSGTKVLGPCPDPFLSPSFSFPLWLMGTTSTALCFVELPVTGGSLHKLCVCGQLREKEKERRGIGFFKENCREILAQGGCLVASARVTASSWVLVFAEAEQETYCPLALGLCNQKILFLIFFSFQC